MKVIEGKSVYSVTEVNVLARRTLEQINFWVEGELSSFKGYDSRYRYLYFDLKDPQTNYKLPCIFDPEVYLAQGYEFEDGMKVLALGTLTLWEKEGRFQMYVVKMQEFGEGFLLAQLEQLKRKLEQKGYFDTKYKKPLPSYPQNIAVISSRVSDAWHDFKKHSQDKIPSINLTLFDVLVQGEKSASQIVSAIKTADKMKFELIVIIRGGGSMEDLAPFNNEVLATAIFKAKTPILVGVGHEKDVTIAQLGADVAASTPTDAAKILTKNFSELAQKLIELMLRTTKALKNLFWNKSQQLDFAFQRLLTSKRKYIALPQNLTFFKRSLILSFQRKILENQKRLKNYKSTLILDWKSINAKNLILLNNYHRQLMLTSPENILNRGYSITYNLGGLVIRDVSLVDIGQKLKVKLAKGRLSTKVYAKTNQ